MPRVQLYSHSLMCPFNVVKCKFGCGVDVERSLLLAHYQDVTLFGTVHKAYFDKLIIGEGSDASVALEVDIKHTGKFELVQNSFQDNGMSFWKKLRPGQYIDARDENKDWSIAKIVEAVPTSDTVTLVFIGFSPKRWIFKKADLTAQNESMLQPLGTRITVSNYLPGGKWFNSLSYSELTLNDHMLLTSLSKGTPLVPGVWSCCQGIYQNSPCK